MASFDELGGNATNPALLIGGESLRTNAVPAGF